MNEVTSKKVAKIASKVLARLSDAKLPDDSTRYVSIGNIVTVCTVAELKSVCASALTQSADRKKK